MATTSRDYEAYRDRRLLAVPLFEQGARPADIARALGVKRQSVHEWFKAWQAGGWEALAVAKKPGRTPRLNEDQRLQVQQAVIDGPVPDQFEDQRWTLPRVRDFIEQMWGVHHGQTQTWRILHSLGLSNQKPRRQAAQQDPEEVKEWFDQKVPAIKKRP